jgi:hypothetical protein
MCQKCWGCYIRLLIVGKKGENYEMYNSKYFYSKQALKILVLLLLLLLLFCEVSYVCDIYTTHTHYAQLHFSHKGTTSTKSLNSG